MPVYIEDTPALKIFRALTHTMGSIPPDDQNEMLARALDSIKGDEEWELIVQSFPSIRDSDSVAVTGLSDSPGSDSETPQGAFGIRALPSPILLNPLGTPNSVTPENQPSHAANPMEDPNHLIFSNKPNPAMDSDGTLNRQTLNTAQLNPETLSKEPLRAPDLTSTLEYAVGMKGSLLDVSLAPLWGIDEINFHMPRGPVQDTSADAHLAGTLWSEYTDLINKPSQVAQPISEGASESTINHPPKAIEFYRLLQKLYEPESRSIAVPVDQNDFSITSTPGNFQTVTTHLLPLAHGGSELNLSQRINQEKILQPKTGPSLKNTGPSVKIDQYPGTVSHHGPEPLLQVNLNVQLQNGGPSCSQSTSGTFNSHYQTDQVLAYMNSTVGPFRHPGLEMTFDYRREQPMQKVQTPLFQNSFSTSQHEATEMIFCPKIPGEMIPTSMYLMHQMSAAPVPQDRRQATESYPHTPGGMLHTSTNQMSSNLYTRRTKRISQMNRKNDNHAAQKVGPTHSQNVQPPQQQASRSFNQVPFPIAQNIQEMGFGPIASHLQTNQMSQQIPAQQPQAAARLGPEGGNFHPQRIHSSHYHQKIHGVGSQQKIGHSVDRSTEKTVSHSNIAGVTIFTPVQQGNQVSSSLTAQNPRKKPQVGSRTTNSQAHQPGCTHTQQVQPQGQQAQKSGYQSLPSTPQKKVQRSRAKGARTHSNTPGTMTPSPMHPMNLSLTTKSRQMAQMSQNNANHENQNSSTLNQQIQDIQWKSDTESYMYQHPSSQNHNQGTRSEFDIAEPTGTPPPQTNGRETSLHTYQTDTAHNRKAQKIQSQQQILTALHMNSPSNTQGNTEAIEAKVSPRMGKTDTNHPHSRTVAMKQGNPNLHVQYPVSVHDQSTLGSKLAVRQAMSSIKGPHSKHTRKRKQSDIDLRLTNEALAQDNPKRKYKITTGRPMKDNQRPTDPVQNQFRQQSRASHRQFRLALPKTPPLISQDNTSSSVLHEEAPVNKDQSGFSMGQVNVDEHAEPARPNRKQAAHKRKPRKLSQTSQPSTKACPSGVGPSRSLPTAVLPQNQVDQQQQELQESYQRYAAFQQLQQYSRAQFEQHQRLQQQNFQQQPQPIQPTHPMIPQQQQIIQRQKPFQQLSAQKQQEQQQQASRPKPQNQQPIQKQPPSQDQQQNPNRQSSQQSRSIHQQPFQKQPTQQQPPNREQQQLVKQQQPTQEQRPTQGQFSPQKQQAQQPAQQLQTQQQLTRKRPNQKQSTRRPEQQPTQDEKPFQQRPLQGQQATQEQLVHQQLIEQQWQAQEQIQQQQQ